MREVPETPVGPRSQYLRAGWRRDREEGEKRGKEVRKKEGVRKRRGREERNDCWMFSALYHFRYT